MRYSELYIHFPENPTHIIFCTFVVALCEQDENFIKSARLFLFIFDAFINTIPQLFR